MRILIKPQNQYNLPLFKDRTDGGKKLGQKLKKLNLKNPVVLAIPSGGVPVGLKVAKILKCPFDLVIVRKIQFPWTTEAGFGAVTPDGNIYLSPHAKGLPPEIIKPQAEKALKSAKQRERDFLKRRKRVSLKRKTVVLVDDGIGTGSTMSAAANLVKKKKPAQVIIASPTASEEGIEFLKKEVDKVITLYQHPKGLPFAIASSYEKWHDLTDKEVKKYLGKISNV